ncbi:terminase large subunit [Microcystis phage Me-ZS1]|nr:terminase large subunit [Microcystis phage Me-ZS1]
MQPKKVDVVWQPLPGSQTLALACPCEHILFHGTRGPGKTDAQLMKFRRYVGLGYGSFWKGIILDRTYKNLDDIITKSERWFPKFNDGARFLRAKSDYKWVWPTGEELLIRRVRTVADYWDYHGHEYPFIGWNELTKQPTPELYEMMMSCNRTSFIPSVHSPIDRKTGERKLLPPIPLVVFSTTNPYGPGHPWVRQRFVDASKPGQVLRTVTEVFNPQTQRRENVTVTQTHIFGSYRENKYLDPKYVAQLESITDPNKRRAWLYGDWNVVSGGALSDLWGDHLILPRFRVPAGWRVDRSFDWGSTHPFSVGWWAEANGEEVVLPDGRRFCPPRGTIIRIAEWYGTEEIGTNTGLRLSSSTIAKGIRDREEAMRKEGWIQGKVFPGPADNQIRDVRESDTPTIEKKMAEYGITWTPSDKSAGSRKIGLELIRERMEASADGDSPGIYFTENCRASRAILPVLPMDEVNLGDVDTKAEDHIYDDVRYRVLAAKRHVSVQNLEI